MTHVKRSKPSRHAKWNRHQLYILERGAILATPYIDALQKSCPYGLVLLGNGDATFNVASRRVNADYQAAALKPLAYRRIRASNEEFIAIAVDPRHEHFARFCSIAQPCAQPLYRATFATHEPALLAAANGELSGADATDLFEAVLKIVSRQLPLPARAPDPRIAHALELLDTCPELMLSELAKAIGVSTYRMSHLFSESVGLPLRSYQLWRKLYSAGRFLHGARSLAEISRRAGFHDQQHMNRTFWRAFGASPPYFLRSRATCKVS